MRLARGGALSLLGAVALLATGCFSLAEPQGWAAPTFLDGTVLVYGDSELRAVDLESGSVQWLFPDEVDPEQRDLDIEAIYAEPVLAGDLLIVATYSDGLFALDPEDGDIRWRFNERIDGNIVGSPALIDDQVFLATSHGRVYSVTTEGRVAPGWPAGGVNVGEGVWSRVLAIDDDTVVVGTMRGHVRALDAATGDIRPGWAFEAGGAVPDIALIDGLLFVPSFDRHVYLLDPETGEPLHPEGFQTEAWVWQEPAFDGERAYFADLEGNVYGLNITTGDADWTAQLSGNPKVKASPVLADGRLVVVDRDRSAAIFEADTGALSARFPVPVDGGTIRAPLRLRDGLAYLITTDGDIWRIDPEEREAEELARRVGD